jgi:nitrogen fixation NifU-like protein
MDSQLYQQEILEHFRNPQNFGKLKKPTRQVKKVNELCGDEITIHLALDTKGTITDVRFSGSGCALSVASASLFTERIKGKTLGQVKKIRPAQLLKALKVPVGTARQKCVLLPLDALKNV